MTRLQRAGFAKPNSPTWQRGIIIQQINDMEFPPDAIKTARYLTKTSTSRTGSDTIPLPEVAWTAAFLGAYGAPTAAEQRAWEKIKANKKEDLQPWNARFEEPAMKLNDGHTECTIQSILLRYLQGLDVISNRLRLTKRCGTSV
jgi:hypothetical protein